MLDSVERGEWRQIPSFKREAKRFQESAQVTLRKDKRVNIRMTERDLIHFQKRAMEEGLPYQTLISSILHKYINGRLIEKASQKYNMRVLGTAWVPPQTRGVSGDNHDKYGHFVFGNTSYGMHDCQSFN